MKKLLRLSAARTFLVTHVLFFLLVLGVLGFSHWRENVYLADSLAGAARNHVVSGDYREVLGLLKHSVGRSFTSVRVRDRESRELVAIPPATQRKGAHWLLPTLERRVELKDSGDGGHILGVLEFEFVLFGGMGIAVFALLSGLLPAMLTTAWQMRRISREHQLEIAVQQQKARTRIAQQVAHDIRSPLAALTVVARELNGDEDTRLLMRSAINRIRDIANNLLEQYREEQIDAVSKMSAARERLVIQPLAPLVDSLVSEKRKQYRLKAGVEIDTQFDSTSYLAFAKVDSVELRRALSNLVDNAVEALQGKGSVSISLRADNEHAVIRVIDSGVGIPEDLLPRLGDEGVTYGKSSGNGLGLAHARSFVEAVRGSLRIESKLGEGTTVILRFPQSKMPEWYVSRIQIGPGVVVGVLDDDATIHQVWRGRFGELGRAVPQELIRSFVAAEEFRDWLARDGSGQNALFLLDHELLGSDETGLDLIESLKIASRSILVTSRYEEERVIERCRIGGIKLLPKSMAAFVPIEKVPASSG